ncbi:50S ribosomal protein L33 [Candidatus Daviesbacteria bacterium RIFCSPLOWO2_02_FULL_40_8]|uniref:Large ribosomal subunit protein bL33 n=1 Tax=Candidatus Daviesbacteria bacterium RIFCSPLOWO2_01_FULL_40_24 TaxID=1797787 RepID=A0A1F5MJV0_9BACT|nr:MAG: 50S ribosomal protein L33 [Candidatus Daviesbacteria bacterium RIFCSPHIGHO2_01_FULL_41_45]OGE35480.1 MAG: 50S ribosomal protein L33 [Candidatus Daviesbacteria bacterium RIFCSPHIGHO2_02_FULL_41_14]OGE65570.1 MAG: 50S ribosomal protein L33 [Candidatus Daviesbacteria bacterium RIFCSPLOWO2_01_FULL_40_24]OGE67142.1 MAG: 50S ribosomal protein L33 [Candidatus Daviesbacteria bacterium RIFCSPLOWO2_02_FULL_40_8]
MAKKSNRQLITFECSVCKNRNYLSEKNTNTTKDKVSLSKYCKSCQKHTSHSEGKVK